MVNLISLFGVTRKSAQRLRGLTGWGCYAILSDFESVAAPNHRPARRDSSSNFISS